jgi:hypothetical protein
MASATNDSPRPRRAHTNAARSMGARSGMAATRKLPARLKRRSLDRRGVVVLRGRPR